MPVLRLGPGRWLRILVVAGLALATPAVAGRIAVVPIRIMVEPASSFCALHVSNQGDSPVAVQVRGFRWRQEASGADLLEPTGIRLNPAILTLAPQQKRLVRCSLPPPSGAGEDSFRLLVDELPEGEPMPGTMRTLLRLSLPVLRTPRGARPLLRWSTGPDGTPLLRNHGNASILVSRLVIGRTGGAASTLDRSFYLLAGSSRALSGDVAGRGVRSLEVVDGLGQHHPVERARD